MSPASPEFRPVGTCEATRLRRFVDSVINAAAIQEAEEATDALQAPGAEPEEYKVYLDDTLPDFTPQKEACVRCKGGIVRLSREGQVTQPGVCEVEDLCQLTDVRMHPENYVHPDGAPRTEILQCGAIECTAFVRATPDGRTYGPSVVSGVCTSDSRKDTWIGTYADAMDKLRESGPVTAPVHDALPITQVPGLK